MNCKIYKYVTLSHLHKSVNLYTKLMSGKYSIPVLHSWVQTVIKMLLLFQPVFSCNFLDNGYIVMICVTELTKQSWLNVSHIKYTTRMQLYLTDIGCNTVTHISINNMKSVQLHQITVRVCIPISCLSCTWDILCRILVSSDTKLLHIEPLQ